MRLAKPVLALCLLAGAGTLYGQTQLTSGVPVHFLVTEIYAVVLNGANGYVIPIPPDPIELSVNVQIAPPAAALEVFVRCGQDVGGANGVAVFDTMGVTANGVVNVFLARPKGGADGNCYIAFEPSATAAGGIGGRLTATVQPLPSGAVVDVTSLASIYLAGQPAGTRFGSLSAPSNSPPRASIAITPGQAVSIVAGGQMNNTPTEGAPLMPVLGTTNQLPELTVHPGQGALGLSNVVVRSNSLLGVFTGDAIDGANAPLSLDFFYGGLGEVPTLYPKLQQVFYVGDGVTSDGKPRVFVAPPGATRLYLASSAGGFNSSGAVSALVSPIGIPAPVSASNPFVVPATADLFFADQPDGTTTGTTFASALTPYSIPPKVPLSLTAGQNLHIRARESIVPPNNLLQSIGITQSPTAASNGLSTLEPVPGLMGVFVGDHIDTAHTPPGLLRVEFIQTLQPLLQQTFYIGNGLTPTGDLRSFTVPTGATRLFLANYGGGVESSGSTVVMVSPDNPNAPQISTGGIVSNAGFATGPVAAGSMVAIFGTNLGATSLPTATPLPTKLGGAQIYFDTIPAPLFYVSSTQVVAQVPMELYGKTSALVTPVNNGVPGVAQTVKLAPFAAGVFTTGTGDPIITDYNTGALVSPSAPASRGDTLIIWATGIGPTVLDPATGHIAPNAASPASLPITVALKSASSGTQITPPVAYAGLAPGFIALDQINVQIPQDAPTGTIIVTLQSPGLTPANPVTIGIK